MPWTNTIRFILIGGLLGIVGSGITFSTEYKSADQASHSPSDSASQSCNLYFSSRFCRPCLSKVEDQLANFRQIDTLFMVTELNNEVEQDNFFRLINRYIKIPIQDTIYHQFSGSVFSEKTQTTFSDSCLNVLFNKSAPFIFSRTRCDDFTFFGT